MVSRGRLTHRGGPPSQSVSQFRATACNYYSIKIDMKSHQDPLPQWRDARLQYFLDSGYALDANLPSHPINPGCLERVISEAQEAQRFITTRIEKLKTAHAVLKQLSKKSHFLVPICKLSPEVLLQIFQSTPGFGAVIHLKLHRVLVIIIFGSGCLLY